MKTQIISAIVAASILPFLTGCEKSQAATAVPDAKPPFEYTVITTSSLGPGHTESMDALVIKGWEPISIGGGEGLGAGQVSVLLRRAKQ